MKQAKNNNRKDSDDKHPMDMGEDSEHEENDEK